MYLQNRSLILTYRGLLVVAASLGILLELDVFKGHCHWDRFVFYTLLSNLACLLFFAAAFCQTAKLLIKDAPNGDASLWPHFKGAVTMLITVTLLVYHFMLAPRLIQNPDYGFWSLRNMLLHYVTPIMVILDWLLFDRKGGYRWYSPLLWLIIPVIYLIFILIRAELAGVISHTHSRYPYFFLDVDVLGVRKVVMFVLAIAVFFVVMGYIFRLVDFCLAARCRLKPREQSVVTERDDKS